jgi:hypothetical protein
VAANATGVPFPLPVQLPAITDAGCSAAVRAVQDGLALEDDLWLAVSCIVDGLARAGRNDDVSRFLRDVREFESTTAYILQVSREQAEGAGLHPPPKKAEGAEKAKKVSIYATPEARARTPALAHVEAATLGPGSYRGLCLPWQRKAGVGGHYEVTQKVIEEVRKRGISITPKAADVMDDAAQDPDSFAWEDMRAHGQTADTDGLPSESANVAEEKWRGWAAGWFAEAGVRCAKGGPGALEGIYLLGYASHAVQDAASHRGRTNPEHAYNALFESNPDKVSGVDGLAVEMSASALETALHGKARSCIDPLRTVKSGVLLFPDKLKRFGFHWDGTPVGLAAYELSAGSFRPHKDKPDARVRWFGPTGDWPKGRRCVDDKPCKDLLERLNSALR